jgi:hypothetical protein
LQVSTDWRKFVTCAQNNQSFQLYFLIPKLQTPSVLGTSCKLAPVGQSVRYIADF